MFGTATKYFRDKGYGFIRGEDINVTRQNLSNKMSRDKFSSLELVEIADALEMNLILKDKADGTEYVIDYPEDEKGKSKRNMTEEEKKAAQKKSEETKDRNAKKQAESQDNDHRTIKKGT